MNNLSYLQLCYLREGLISHQLLAGQSQAFQGRPSGTQPQHKYLFHHALLTFGEEACIRVTRHGMRNWPKWSQYKQKLAQTGHFKTLNWPKVC